MGAKPAVGPPNLKDFGVRVVGGLTGPVHKPKSVQLFRHRKSPAQHLVQRKVGLEGLVVHGKQRFFALFGDKGDVPALQVGNSTLFRCKVPQGLGFLLDDGLGFLCQVLQKCRNGFRRFGHALFQHEIGVGSVAQELGALAAQADQFRHGLPRVVGISPEPPLGKGPPQQFAAGSVFRIRQIGQVRRGMQGEQPSGGLSGVPRGLFGRGQGVGGNSRHFLGKKERERLSLQVGQDLLSKPQRRQAQRFVHGPQPRLVFVGQKGAVSHEPAVGQIQQPLLLAGESPVRIFLYGADTSKQLRIQADVVA